MGLTREFGSGTDLRPEGFHPFLSVFICSSLSFQPQSYVVPSSIRFRMILECRPIMQNPMIVREHHLTRLERKLHPHVGS